MAHSFYFIFSFAIINAVFCQVTLPGPCPEFQPMKNFESKRFQGTWYIIAGSGNAPYEQYGRCDTWTFEGNETGVLRSQFQTMLVDSGDVVGFEGQLTPIGGPTSASFLVTSPDLEGIPNVRYFIVLHTDYDHFAVEAACRNSGDVHIEYNFIMSRNNTLDDEFMRLAKEYLRNGTDVPVSELYRRNQENCT